MTQSPGELHRRAVDLSNRRKYASARRLLELASARTDDLELGSRIAGTLAFVIAQTGEPQKAEAICHHALARDGLSDETRAVLFGQLGTIATHSGRLDQADAWLVQAIGVLPRDSVEAAHIRLNRGVVSLQRRAPEEADEDFSVAARLYEANGMGIYAARAKHNIGYAALLRGDLVRAITVMNAARPVLSQDSPVSLAISDIDRAEVLRDAGLVTEAERLMESTAKVFGAHRMRQARGETELNLARSLLRHDPAKAATVARTAARRFTALGSESWAARADGIRVRALLAGGAADRGGRIIADPRRVPSSDEIERTADDLDRSGFRGEASAVRLSAELWSVRHGLGAASRARRTPRAAPLDVRLLSHEVRAARATAAGRPAEARRHAARGIDELSAWQRSFGSLDLQTSLAMHGNGLMLEGIGAAVRSGRPDVVFEWAERARHFSQQVVSLRPPPDPALAADLSELRMLRADLAADEWLADPRAVELSEQLRARQWESTRAADVEDRVDLAELHATLDADTALLAYVFGPTGLSCLVVTSSEATLVDVPEWQEVRAALPGLRADLDMSASIRIGPMADVVRRSLETRLATLSRALVAGPLARTDARRLVITVPGVLAGMPWGMLPGMRGRAFTLAGSASRWVRGRDAVTAGLSDAMAGAGRPNDAGTPLHAGFAVGPRVARGGEEVRIAASAWQHSIVLAGSNATVDAVTALAEDVDVLHIAAHGRHAVDNPLFSGLDLADGALFGYDIDRMPRVPGLVVLSACEVGRSSVRWGEEAVGMTRAWLHAGSRCVVAAPVVVADDVACELLGAMHQGLAAGMAPADALAAASTDTGIIAPFQSHGSGF